MTREREENINTSYSRIGFYYTWMTRKSCQFGQVGGGIRVRIRKQTFNGKSEVGSRGKRIQEKEETIWYANGNEDNGMG